MSEKDWCLGKESKGSDALPGWFKKYVAGDVVVAGAGPAGLVAALTLSKMNLKVLVLEQNSSPGGRLWEVDFLTNISERRGEVQEIMDEIKIPYKKAKGGLRIASGVHVTSKLISACCDAGVKILNMSRATGLVCNHERIDGITLQWSPRLPMKNQVSASVSATVRCDAIIDATGTEACVCQMLIGKDAVHAEDCHTASPRTAELLLLEKSTLVYPGLVMAGLAAAAVHGIPLVGLSLCSLMLSGRKAAQEAALSIAENYFLSSK